MHPTVVSDRPGTCPVCGMDLVMKARPGEELQITEDLSPLLESPNEVVLGSVKTIRGQFSSRPITVEATGVVTYDPRRVYSLSARVAGRLEKVYVRYNYQPIRKGQKVAEIYSPELVTAQRELLFLLQNDPDNHGLVRTAETRLELLGLTSSQIRTVRENRAPQSTFAIYSLYDGFAVATRSTPPAAPPAPATANKMGDMQGATTASVQRDGAANKSEALLKEGDYVTAGETLVEVVDLSALRIALDVPAAQAGSIEQGDRVLLTLGGGKTITATIDLIVPFYTAGENFVKLRVYTDKEHDLRPGQLVKGRITIDSKETLWVPKDAVVDLGIKQVVFIKSGEVMKPKSVGTGIETDNWIEITAGLASSDEFAADAHYLVDSESFIKPRE